MLTIIFNIYLEFAERVDLKHSYHTHTQNYEVMDLLMIVKHKHCEMLIKSSGCTVYICIILFNYISKLGGR